MLYGLAYCILHMTATKLYIIWLRSPAPNSNVLGSNSGVGMTVVFIDP